ncbi:GerMN domain-containing protein [PVC group bacterium]|nr:GerMN domain-containing protein [PVC group bacterium]
MARKRRKTKKKSSSKKRRKRSLPSSWLFTLLISGGILAGVGAYFYISQNFDFSLTPKSGPSHQQGAESTEKSARVKAKISIRLYYYNWKKDKQIPGPTETPEMFLSYVNRRILRTRTPIQDTIRLLLQGGLTAKEKEEGFFTELPAAGFRLQSVDLDQGILKLQFVDLYHFTVGGSQQVQILKAQIVKTAMQFSSVEKVQIFPDSLFQP